MLFTTFMKAHKKIKARNRKNIKKTRKEREKDRHKRQVHQIERNIEKKQNISGS